MAKHERRMGAEVRQLYARDMGASDDAPLFFLERGAADEVRPLCHSGHLICPYPGCESPRYSTRGGQRRDHFFHVNAPATPHDPESFHHFTAKHLIGSWVQGRYPDARVQVDHEPIENDQVPDVLVEFPDGRRYAFEVQYSPITEADWDRRHQGYRAQGVTDIWLFGHAGTHGRWRDGKIRFSELLEHVEAQTHLVRWIDPEERSILARPHYTGGACEYVKWFGLAVSVVKEPFESLELDTKGLVSPLVRRERAAYAEFLRQEQEESARLERRMRAFEENERRRQAWLAKSRQEREEWQAKRDAWQMKEWQQLKAELEAQYGQLPEVIYAHHRSEKWVNALPAWWHVTLMLKVLEGRIGRVSQFGHCFHAVEEKMPRNRDYGFQALQDYLAILERYGYVSWEEGDPKPVLRILHDLSHPPPGKPYSSDGDGGVKLVTADGEIVTVGRDPVAGPKDGRT